MLIDDETSRNIRLHHHHQSLLGAAPAGDQLYSNLYGKDMGLMRKMMNIDEFPNGNNFHPNNMNPQKTFPNFPNGQFNAKFSSPPQNYGFPFDKMVHPPNGIRHEGLLKPCYDYPAATTKMENAETLIDSFGYNKKPSPTSLMTAAGFMSQYHQQSPLMPPSSTTTNGLVDSQFSHGNNFGNHKTTEINNNGIVLKMENGGLSSNNTTNDFNMQINNNNNNVHKTNEILCSRSSNTINLNNGNNNPSNLNSKNEPNEFNNLNSSHKDEDEDNKSSLHEEDSNDGFTNL